MKVGLLIDDHMARPGGVQEYVRGLYRYLVQQGHEAVVFSSGGRTDELRIVAIGSALPLRGSGSTTSVPLTLASPRQIRRLLEAEACDVLHVMAPYSPTLSGRLLAHSQAAHVMTFLVAIEPGPYRRGLAALARLQWRSLGRVHARVAISPTAAETGHELYGGKYHLVPCGVDTAQFAPASQRGAASDGTTLLYVGRLEERKGVRHLIDAVARLAPQVRGLRLIIGGDGPQRASLEQLVRQRGLRCVAFLGYVPSADLPALLQSADVFCAPATYAESFGIVLVEAMAAGLPIVAAANAGYAGLLAAHPGNLLVPPGDDRALAGALAAVTESPAYRRRVGARNRADVERYSWSTVGAQIMAVYQQALQETSRNQR